LRKKALIKQHAEKRIILFKYDLAYLSSIAVMRTEIRDIIGIMSLILDIANQENGTKHRSLYNIIMYKVALCHPGLKDLVTILTTHGLLSYDDLAQTYRTTEKGLQFLNKYNQIVDFIKEEERLRRE
jgi:predicted transcriptional regulator